MSTPCEQKQSIENISKTLDRMERSQEKLVELLEKVSNQDARINHLEEHAERAYTEVNELFTRMREAEMNVASSGPSVRQQFHDTVDLVNEKLDKLMRVFEVTTSRPAVMVYGAIIVMIVAGTFLDFMYHFDMLKAMYHFIKG